MVRCPSDQGNIAQPTVPRSCRNRGCCSQGVAQCLSWEGTAPSDTASTFTSRKYASLLWLSILKGPPNLLSLPLWPVPRHSSQLPRQNQPMRLRMACANCVLRGPNLHGALDYNQNWDKQHHGPCNGFCSFSNVKVTPAVCGALVAFQTSS